MAKISRSPSSPTGSREDHGYVWRIIAAGAGVFLITVAVLRLRRESELQISRPRLLRARKTPLKMVPGFSAHCLVV